MRSFLLRILLFTTLVIAIDRLFVVFRYANANVFAHAATDKRLAARRDFIDPAAPFDTWILGSSHAQFGIDPGALRETLTGSAYNIADGGGTNVGYQYALLTELLAVLPRPQRVIYAVDVFSLNEPPRAQPVLATFGRSASDQPATGSDLQSRLLLHSHAYRYGRGIPRYLGDVARGDVTPPILRSVDASLDRTPFNSYIGYEVSTAGQVKGYGTVNPAYVRYGGVVFQPSPASATTLANVVALCRTAGITLYLIHVPEHAAARRYAEKYDAFDTWMTDFVAGHGVAWLDFNDETRFPLAEDDLFFDTDHLNAMGAAMFSRRLGRAIARLEDTAP